MDRYIFSRWSRIGLSVRTVGHHLQLRSENQPSMRPMGRLFTLAREIPSDLDMLEYKKKQYYSKSKICPRQIDNAALKPE